MAESQRPKYARTDSGSSRSGLFSAFMGTNGGNRRPSFALSDASPPTWTLEGDEQMLVADGHVGSGQQMGSFVGSPFSRAGLLAARSYASSALSHHHRDTSSTATTLPAGATAHQRGPHHFPSQSDIRDTTMQISSMTMTSPIPPLHAVSERRESFNAPAAPSESLIFPSAPSSSTPHPAISLTPPSSSRTTTSSSLLEDLSASTSTLASDSTQTPTCTATTSTGLSRRTDDSHRGREPRPSGLSLLLAKHDEQNTPSSSTQGSPTPTREHPLPVFPRVESSPPPIHRATNGNGHAPYNERTPLLRDVEANRRLDSDGSPASHKSPQPVGRFTGWASTLRKTAFTSRNAKDLLTTCVKSLPAVLLGGLLNVLDGISYGMIIFPAAGVFADLGLGAVGVSMFFVSAIISQLVYSAGASGFAGGNGSMMIEVVPFFHIIANSIAQSIGDDKPHEIVATTLIAFALSSVLTGLSFFLLGALRLGALIGFFPRHILVGCIGGVGVFLMITGFTVSARIDDDDFGFTCEVFAFFFLNTHTLALWVPALTLAVLLRVITHRFHHQLIFPAYFLTIPIVFYIIVLAAGFDLQLLRSKGWLFDVGSADEPWWKFYTYFDFRAVHWDALAATLPTQFALLFFNILHPPLNVPALAVSLDEDVDTNKELVAHGYSNLLAGLLGTVPNYLVYVNTLLFYRVGGDTRTSGFLLAAATAGLLLIGTGPIAYIPVMVVGALIFVLGIDLVKEALWDCRHRVTRTEYITIASIMVVMTAFDFVMGVLFGIVISCFFFVVQNSQRRSIRALYTGESAMSTVRRPNVHREYLRVVSKQTTILRLQGFLFFGTITNVEETIRSLVEQGAWQRNPIRFLVCDLTLVAGVDMSASEAFVRVQRILAARHVVLCFCGASPTSPVGRALQSVGLLEMEGVEIFASVNEAMEWTENAYLRSWFMSHKAESAEPVALPGRQKPIEFGTRGSVAATPRWTQIHEAGWKTIGHPDRLDTVAEGSPEPFNTLQKVFASHSALDRQRFQPLIASLERVTLAEGDTLFSKGDHSDDGLFLIESGVLRATYEFADFMPHIEESMVPGTIAGELSALSGEPRNATVVAERDAVVWRLSVEKLNQLETTYPELARDFTRMVLKSAKVDFDILLSALATRQ